MIFFSLEKNIYTREREHGFITKIHHKPNELKIFRFDQEKEIFQHWLILLWELFLLIAQGPFYYIQAL